MEKILAVVIVTLTAASIARFLYVGFGPQGNRDEFDATTELAWLGLAIGVGGLGGMMAVYDAFIKICSPNASPLC